MTTTVADERAFRRHLDSAGSVDDSWTYAAEIGVDHQQLVGLLKSLSADGVVDLTSLSTSLLELTAEGESVLTQACACVGPLLLG